MGEGVGASKTTDEPLRHPPKKKKKKIRLKFARNQRMKREKKGGISYDRYADAIASGAITLELSQSDAIMHRMKTEGQARKLSKASLLSALEKSHEESISHREEAASAARALESVEERNRRLQLKNQELKDRVRGARAEVREQKSAQRRLDALAEDST